MRSGHFGASKPPPIPEVVPTLEAEVNTLAEACFGKDAGLTKETEFHATNNWSGAKNFLTYAQVKADAEQLAKVYR